MRNHHSYTVEQLHQYLALPVSRRPLATYQLEFLEPTAAFSVAEIERLTEIVSISIAIEQPGEPLLGDPGYPKTKDSKLLIDLSWASSQLEGNTYTYVDTQVLIEYGQQREDKPVEDAAMILNHKRAIEFMRCHSNLTADNAKRIHAYLMDNRLAPNSRHFLKPDRCGMIRSYTPNGLEISGSSYLPPQAEDRPFKFIDNEFDRLMTSVHSLNDPINQAFFLMTRLPYLQPFYDGNKRTSRICCNIPLIANKLTPMSFVDFEKNRYGASMLAFYELGDERLAKDAFLHTYLFSAFRYLRFSEAQRAKLAVAMDQQVADAKRFVINGVIKESPIWKKE